MSHDIIGTNHSSGFFYYSWIYLFQGLNCTQGPVLREEKVLVREFSFSWVYYCNTLVMVLLLSVSRSEIVREACVKGLLHSWSSNLNGDLLALLSKLDVESSSEVRIQPANSATISTIFCMTPTSKNPYSSTCTQLCAFATESGRMTVLGEKIDVFLWYTRLNSVVVQVAEQALCRLLEEIDVGLVVQSTVELMDPANRLESWDDEDEERVEMTVTERVLPYDLLHSAEAFYWSCVCRSVLTPSLCILLCRNIGLVTCTKWETKEISSWRRFFRLCLTFVSTFNSKSLNHSNTLHTAHTYICTVPNVHVCLYIIKPNVCPCEGTWRGSCCQLKMWRRRCRNSLCVSSSSPYSQSWTSQMKSGG